MIEDIYGRRGAKMISCDNCCDGFEADSFAEAKQRMRDEGWRTRLIDGTHKHFCPECKEVEE